MRIHLVSEILIRNLECNSLDVRVRPGTTEIGDLNALR